MPPRWLCCVIIAFWLGVTGWLLWSELRDRFAVNEPPPFVIDLVDEAQPERDRIRWRVWQGDELPVNVNVGDIYSDLFAKLAAPDYAPLSAVFSFIGLNYLPPATFTARTFIDHREKQDDFLLRVEFIPTITRPEGMVFDRFKLKRMNSEYRVDRAGRLLGTKAYFEFDLDFLGGSDMTVQLEGEVRGREFFSRFRVHSPILEHEKELDPIPVSYRGSVLMPTHPVNKLRGLRPGQTWTIPLFNPLGEALGNTLPGANRFGERTLRAHVLPELRPLPLLPPIAKGLLRDEKPISCLVIEYEDDDENTIKPRTWIRAADGLVLRQESDLFGRRLIMQRDVFPDVSEK